MSPVLATAAAALCAVLAGATGGPLRVAAGLLLCLYLPGRLAVTALFRPDAGLDPVLRTVLTAALSLGTTMVVGLAIAASGLGFRAGTGAGGMFAGCLLFAAAAFRHRRSPAGRPVLPRPRWHWFAAVPAALLCAVLVVQIGATVRYRPAGSWYTELALAGETGRDATVVVDSRERGTLDFRYEERVDGVVLYTTGFALAPGERRQFTVSRAGAVRIEIRLYRGDDSTPYRYLIF